MAVLYYMSEYIMPAHSIYSICNIIKSVRYEKVVRQASHLISMPCSNLPPVLHTAPP